MKKFKFLSVAAALLAASVMVSCTSSDDPVVKPVITGMNTGEIVYKVTVKSNVETKFTFNGVTKTGTTAEFDVNASDYKAALEAKAEPVDAAYSLGEKKAKVAFSTEKQTALVEFNFVKPSTETKTQAEMIAGATVGNSAANQKAAGVDVAIAVPEGTVITGNTTDPFSITAYKMPASLESTEIKKNETKTVDIYTFDCNPDGAKFDTDIVIKVNLGKEAAGLVVAVDDVDYTVGNDGFVSIKASHFSNLILAMKAAATDFSNGSQLIYEKNIDVVAGKNEFAYTKKTGIETSATGVLLQYLTTLCGDLQTKDEEEKGSFESSAAGKASLKVEQEYTDYTFKSGSVNFKARVWAEVKATVTPSDGEAHSGGSAQ